MIPRHRALFFALPAAGLVAISLACGGFDFGDLAARGVIEDAAEVIVKKDAGPGAIKALGALDRAYAQAAKNQFDETRARAVLDAVNTAMADGSIDDAEASTIEAACPSDPVPADQADTVNSYHGTVSRRIGRERGSFRKWDKPEMLAAIRSLGFDTDEDDPCNADEDPRCWGYNDGATIRLYHFDYEDVGDARRSVGTDLHIGESGRRDGSVVLSLRVTTSKDAAAVFGEIGAQDMDLSAMDTEVLKKTLTDKGFTIRECESKDEGDGITSHKCLAERGKLHVRVIATPVSGLATSPEYDDTMGSVDLTNRTGTFFIEAYDTENASQILDGLVGEPKWPGT